jgi:hypothetical protein
VLEYFQSESVQGIFKLLAWVGGIALLLFICPSADTNAADRAPYYTSGYYVYGFLITACLLWLVPTISYISVRNAATKASLSQQEVLVKRLKDEADALYQQWLTPAEQAHNGRLQQFQQQLAQRLAEVANVSQARVDELRLAQAKRLSNVTRLFARWKVPIGDAEVRQLLDGRTKYERQLADIGAQHERALADLARRYGAP